MNWIRTSVAFRILLGALVVLAAAGVFWALTASGGPQEVPLSQAVSAIASNQVASAELSDSSSSVVLIEKNGDQIVATYPREYSATLTTDLLAHNVETTAKPPGFWSAMEPFLLTLLPMLLIIGALLYVVKSGAIGGMGQKSKPLGEVPDVTFNDVAGCDEAVADLKEMTEFLRSPERFHRLGATVPRGALLTGPPGTGKTLLARAVAGEAQVPFFAVAGSDFVEMFAGRGASRVRKLFETARKAGKGIVFIDEIDAVAAKRSSGMYNSPGDSEREGTLTALLAEMDGFDRTNIIVLAATNRPDMLDEAITRPGRMDRQIQVIAPDRRGRLEILKLHVRGKVISDDVDLEAIAALTWGMVGSELAMIVNEACMEAARRDSDMVEQVDLTNAVQVNQVGRARTSALVTERDREITAYHEAGHAVAAELLEHVEGPSIVSIIPRGQAGGATHLGGTDNQFFTIEEAHDRMVVMMGGRVGEMLLLGESNFTQGAAHDIQSATGLANAMVTQFGMGTRDIAFVGDDAVRVGGALSVRVHQDANDYLNHALERAKSLLLTGPGKEFVERLVQELQAEETVYRAQMDRLRTECGV